MVTAVEITKETEPISVEEANAEYKKFYQEFAEPAIKRINMYLIMRFVPGVEIVIKRDEYFTNKPYNQVQLDKLFQATVHKYSNPWKRWTVRKEKNGNLVFKGSMKK